MPISRTTQDPWADREGLLRLSVKDFHMANDVGMLKTCPVGHIAWVVVSRTAYIDCTWDWDVSLASVSLIRR